MSFYRRYGKRLLDLALVIAMAPLWLPLLGFGAAIVALTLGRPVIFRQIRAGRGGLPIAITKLRTMTDKRDANGELLPDEARLPRIGKWLRATSIDELPGLLQVLTGQASLVGPRALHLDYVQLYTPEQARRLEVLPGITGWAQINGRNAISWEERFALDVWYIDRIGFLLDVEILLLTIVRVIRRDGISSATSVTMERFSGVASRAAERPERARE